MTRELIIVAYRRLMKDSPGRLPGLNALLRALPGLSQHTFRGNIWRTWRSFQEEVGVQPSNMNARLSDEQVVRGLALLTRKIGRVPLDADIIFERKRDPSVPSQAAVRGRARTTEDRIAILRDFCSSHSEFADIVVIVGSGEQSSARALKTARPVAKGYVYMVRSGSLFKIGRETTEGARQSAAGTWLENPKVIHRIATEDPEHIERYWHDRFKRENKHVRNELFRLTAADVAIFKRWQKIV